MRRLIPVAVLVAVCLMFTGQVWAKRPVVTLTSPDGPSMTFIGEPEKRDEWVRIGNSNGWFARRPYFALRKIEELRLSKLLVLVAGVDVHDTALTWPAGRWVEFTLDDGSTIQPVEVFTCGPKERMVVYPLGLQSRRIPGDQLHVARPPGMSEVVSPVYFALPNSVKRGGKDYQLEMRNIISARLIQVPPDSLTAVAERR